MRPERKKSENTRDFIVNLHDSASVSGRFGSVLAHSRRHNRQVADFGGAAGRFPTIARIRRRGRKTILFQREDAKSAPPAPESCFT
jgi:hypothetical protein